MTGMDIPPQVSVDVEMSMNDGKVMDVLQGDSGSFCKKCDISRDDARSVEFLQEAGVGGMTVTKTNQQCMDRYSKVETGEILYIDSERCGQVHKPLLTDDQHLYGILHQVLRTLDYMLKILYHLVSGQRIWSESNTFVCARVEEAKKKVRGKIGMLLDTPGTTGGNTNCGPLANRFSNPKHVMQFVMKI